MYDKMRYADFPAVLKQGPDSPVRVGRGKPVIEPVYGFHRFSGNPVGVNMAVAVRHGTPRKKGVLRKKGAVRIACDSAGSVIPTGRQFLRQNM